MFICILVAMVGMIPAASNGQLETKSARPVAASVDGAPIHLDEVELELASIQAAKRSGIHPDMRPVFRAWALDRIVGRHLILAEWARAGWPVPLESVETQWKLHVAELESRGTNLESQLRRWNTSLDAYRGRFHWLTQWRSYLELQVEDAEIERRFPNLQRELDGTEMRVSHILFRSPDKDEDVESDAEAIRQADELRKRIIEGEITFAEAASKFSAGPSRLEGGDLGFITRRGEMSEEFARAAFQLQVGEISPPVVSPHGVHLILCTEIKEGSKKSEEMRKALRAAGENRVFKELVERLRTSAKLEFTGVTEYFDPDTNKIVRPESGRQ